MLATASQTPLKQCMLPVLPRGDVSPPPPLSAAPGKRLHGVQVSESEALMASE